MLKLLPGINKNGFEMPGRKKEWVENSGPGLKLELSNWRYPGYGLATTAAVGCAATILASFGTLWISTETYSNFESMFGGAGGLMGVVLGLALVSALLFWGSCRMSSGKKFLCF